MMLAWRSFIVQTDPDVMLGYNIVGFDLPYLINRTAALKIPNFCALGRVKGQLTALKKATFQSKAYGKRESFDAAMIGRVTTDMLVCIQREHKLRSYTLNSASAEFLDEQKDDVHHSMITTLYKGSDDDRRTLAKYCLKDALLPLRLSEKLMTFYNQIEMARVTGVPISYLLSRGQQIKVISQLYRKAKTEGFLIPYHKVEKQAGDDGVAYEGATVIEPKRGFYQAPVATLDFASLYPSIMMAHNLCYCALISKKDTVEGGGKLVLDVDYIRTPAGHLFVKPELQKGLLPRILADLLAQRKKAKTELKTEKDPQKRAVLDGRQLALKVSANSVYGFTGATIGKLPCLEISASVTAFGREMIELSKRIVEETYTVAGGYSHDAVVLYGDTDSIMVKFGTEDLATAMKYGREAAVLITKRFVKPISLEFEKVYWPYLLINKKRYAGLYWTNAEKYDKLDTKGIEVNRRDNFPYLPSVMSKSLNMLLIENNPEGAKAFVRQSISDLLQDKVDMSQLILSKQLSRAAKDYAGKQAHVELAARMAKRDPGSAPKIGDRVPYVITEAHKGAKAFEKSEEPIYAMENGLRLDIAWYIERMYKPLERIFGAVMGNVDSLFRGEHTRTIVRPQAVSGALSRFMKKTERCLGCAALLENEAAAVCEKCAPTAPLIYQQLLEEANEAEQKYARIWTQCQACQGSHHTTIDCSNNECPIFYERAKNKIVAGKTQKELAKFQNIAW
jgi:DNA polymerase delta subunit 1